ncbi:MAG: 4-hydroxy-tetrahydrodipicolinate reductase [Dongiaceae bacterium]
MTEFGIGIVGCAGRMGRMLVETVAARSDCRSPPAASGRAARRSARMSAGWPGWSRSASRSWTTRGRCSRRPTRCFDFSSPAASVANAAAAADAGKIHVIGTTGLGPEHQAAIAAAARRTAIVQAPNMSLGVNLLLGLVREAASRLGPDWDIDILEMHHRHKVDAPSGTALALGRAAAAGRGVALDAVARRSRDGLVGARPAGEIGFATLRGGDVVGDHLVIFAAEGERIELGHRAGSRLVFARGAVHAALWARGQPPGLYGMADVLGLA